MDPWLDEEKLLPGQDWQYEIRRAIKASDIALVCLSTKSITKVGFVQKEIKYALDVADELPIGTIFIIPLRLDECDVPERLQQWQWISMKDPRWYNSLMQAFDHRAESLGVSVKRKGIFDTQSDRYTRIGIAVDDVQALVRDSVGRRNIRIMVDVDRNQSVDIPRDILSLSLTNLVSNAIEAIGSNGTIRITTEDDGLHVRCHISDTGPGIAPLLRDKIFHLGLTTKPDSGGWGLYLTRRSLLEHAGDLVLSETSPQGTRFTILLPKPKPQGGALSV